MTDDKRPEAEVEADADGEAGARPPNADAADADAADADAADADAADAADARTDDRPPDRDPARVRAQAARARALVAPGGRVASRLLSALDDFEPLGDALASLLDPGTEWEGFAEAAELFAQVGREARGEPIELIGAEPRSASHVAQIHDARLAGGDRVVLKMIDPDREQQLARDVETIERSLARRTRRARLLAADSAAAADAAAVAWIAPIARAVTALAVQATDCEREREAMAAMARLCERRAVRIPRAIAGYGLARVAVYERLPGFRADQLAVALATQTPEQRDALLAEADIDLTAVARQVLSFAITSVIDDGVFVADMSPANVRVMPGGHIGFVDGGSACWATARQQRVQRAIAWCIARQDAAALRDLVTRAMGEGARDPAVEADVSWAVTSWMTALPASDTDVASVSLLLWRLADLSRRAGHRVSADIVPLLWLWASAYECVRALAPELDVRQELRMLGLRHAFARFTRRTVFEVVEDTAMLIETLSGDLPRRLMGESEPAPTLIAPSAQAAPTRAPTRRFGVASVLGSAALGAGALAVVAPVSIASGLALIAAGLALLLISR